MGMFRRIRRVNRVRDIDLGRHDFAIARFQQHVVEGKSLILADFVVHGVRSAARLKG